MPPTRADGRDHRLSGGHPCNPNRPSASRDPHSSTVVTQDSFLEARVEGLLALGWSIFVSPTPGGTQPQSQVSGQIIIRVSGVESLLSSIPPFPAQATSFLIGVGTRRFTSTASQTTFLAQFLAG